MKLKTFAGFLFVSAVCIFTGNLLQSEASLHNKAPGVEYVKATVADCNFEIPSMLYAVEGDLPLLETLPVAQDESLNTELVLNTVNYSDTRVPVFDERTENDVSFTILKNTVQNKKLGEYRWKDVHRRIRTSIG